MIIRDRTDAQIEQDTEDFKLLLNELKELQASKNSGIEYAGTWACADLKLRFADVHRKFVRLLGQIWRTPTANHNLKNIRESFRDLAVYAVLGMLETDRLAAGYYQVDEEYEFECFECGTPTQLLRERTTCPHCKTDRPSLAELAPTYACSQCGRVVDARVEGSVTTTDGKKYCQSCGFTGRSHCATPSSPVGPEVSGSPSPNPS